MSSEYEIKLSESALIDLRTINPFLHKLLFWFSVGLVWYLVLTIFIFTCCAIHESDKVVQLHNTFSAFNGCVR